MTATALEPRGIPAAQLAPLHAEEFIEFYTAVRGTRPFPWQVRLCSELTAKRATALHAPSLVPSESEVNV
jgi:hypothetical protein